MLLRKISSVLCAAVFLCASHAGAADATKTKRFSKPANLVFAAAEEIVRGQMRGEITHRDATARTFRFTLGKSEFGRAEAFAAGYGTVEVRPDPADPAYSFVTVTAGYVQVPAAGAPNTHDLRSGSIAKEILKRLRSRLKS